ncbi:hypothetical protein ACFFWD_26200 [Bradyrhizobium erythrophlei]|uniref:hypothetical protein n=1 Tax=Bradyrhizobium erythrophlei TaxID=1437360 RepID=UPI0035EF14ED
MLGETVAIASERAFTKSELSILAIDAGGAKRWDKTLLPDLRPPSALSETAPIAQMLLYKGVGASRRNGLKIVVDVLSQLAFRNEPTGARNRSESTPSIQHDPLAGQRTGRAAELNVNLQVQNRTIGRARKVVHSLDGRIVDVHLEAIGALREGASERRPFA